MFPIRRNSGPATRGAALIEYAILVSALSVASLGATLIYGDEVRRYFQFEGQALSDMPTPDVPHPDLPDYEAGDPVIPALPDPVSPPDPEEGDGHDLPEGPGTPEEPDDTEDVSGGGGEPDPDVIVSPGCGPWRDFDMGVFTSHYAVQVVTAGNRIGFYAANGNLGKKAEEAIDLREVVPLGSAAETYVLVIEHDEAVGHFTDHSRVSVFAEDGDKLVNRALVKLDGPGDLRQGDEYLIAHTMDLMIDINGVDPEKTLYSKSQQGGHWMVGNNDAALAFEDIGCVIAQPAL